MSMIHKILTIQTGPHRFDVELIQAVSIKDDLIYGDFEGFTFKYLDQYVENGRNYYDKEGRWTNIVRLDSIDHPNTSAYSVTDARWTNIVRIDTTDHPNSVARIVSVLTDTIVYSRNA